MEELKRMEKEVREQEQLLTGYQQENERLYKELKQMQAKEKANEARMFSENQKLGKEYFFLLFYSICYFDLFVTQLIFFCFALPFSKVSNALTIYSICKFVFFCDRQFPPKPAWVDSSYVSSYNSFQRF